MCWWGPNQIEPLVLAHELSKKGQQVYLLGNESACTNVRNGAEIIHFSFFLSPRFWEAPWEARIPKRKVKAIYAPDHVRYPEYVSRQVNGVAVLGSSTDPRPYDELLVRDRCHYPSPMHVEFERVSSNDGYAVFKPKKPLPSLTQGFFRLIGPATASAYENAKKAVLQTGAREINMCDLFMFDSALMAHAVCEAGGKLHLWPHSTNPIILPYHKKDWIARAISITISGRDEWAKHLGKEKTHVMSQIMLRKPSIQRPFQDDHPVTVVLFGGAGRCGRMPALNYQAHLNTMRTLMLKLNELPSGYRLILKPKHIWENDRWLRSLAPPNHRFETFNVSPRSFTFSNMVFLTANFGSSALLEGMCNGIPGFVARSTPVTDYTKLSEDRQQVGDIDFVLKQIRLCADKKHYQSCLLYTSPSPRDA